MLGVRGLVLDDRGKGIGQLTPTAANPGVKIGAVSINPASVKLLQDGGFRLEQSGGGEWTIYFANDNVPKVLNKKGGLTTSQPKASYKVGLQVWPEGTFRWKTKAEKALWEGDDGTYALDKSGNKIPVAIGNPTPGKSKGKATTKPTTVNVTIRIPDAAAR